MKITRSVTIDHWIWDKFSDYAYAHKTNKSALLTSLVKTLIDQNMTLDEFGKNLEKENPHFFCELPQMDDYMKLIQKDEEKVKKFNFKLQEWNGRGDLI